MSAPGPRPAAGHPRRDGGQATVEFALVLPLVMTLVIGLVLIARVAAAQVAVVDAARAGARAASVDSGRLTGGGTDGHDTTSVTVAPGEPALVTVRVERTIHLVPRLGFSAVTVKASSTMAVEPAP